MDKTRKKYRLTHNQLKEELKKEQSKYLSKDKIISIICTLLVLIALLLVFIYASKHGLI